jgi:hypothetical protein
MGMQLPDHVANCFNNLSRFLLTATVTSRIVAMNDLHSPRPVQRSGSHFVCLLGLLHVRVSDVRPVLLTRPSD